MTSLFIDSKSKLEGDNYQIPSKIEFQSMKLRSASILNNSYNAVGFAVTVNISSVNIPISLSNGNYTGTEMASYLEYKLNQIGNGTQWKVYFNRAAMKYSIQYTSSSASPVTLTFNSASQSFFGITGTPITFAPNSTTFFEFPNQSLLQPGFYRVECANVSNMGFMVDNNPRSSVIGIIPINSTYGNYTTYENADNFFLSTPGFNDVYNFLQIKIYIAESNVQIQNPVFGLTLQFQ